MRPRRRLGRRRGWASLWDFVARRRRGAAPLRLRRREIRPVAPSRAARLLGARDELAPRRVREGPRALARGELAPRPLARDELLRRAPAQFVGLLVRRLRRRVAAALARRRRRRVQLPDHLSRQPRPACLCDRGQRRIGVSVACSARCWLPAVPGQRQMSGNQSGQPSSPAQNLDGARRPELSVARRRDLGRTARGFVRQCTKPVTESAKLLLCLRAA